MENKNLEQFKDLSTEELESVFGGIINENMMRNGVGRVWEDPEAAAIVIKAAILMGFKDFARKTYHENERHLVDKERIQRMFREAFGEEI